MILNQIITLRGDHKCVLVWDEVAEEASDEQVLLVESSNEHAHIWVRSADIQAARENFGSLPVYGFWQTLLTSKLVDFSKDAFVYEEDPDTRQGVLLSIRSGRAVSSISYFGDYPAGVPLDNIETLDDSILSRLTPPKIQARLPAEVLRAEKRKMRVAVMTCAGIAAGFGVAAWLSDVALQKLSDSRVAQARAIDNESMLVETLTGDLLRNANPVTAGSVERTRTVLRRLYELHEKSQDLRVGNLPMNQSASATVLVRMLPTGLSFESIATATPGKPLTLTFNLDGTAPPSPDGAVGNAQ